MAARRRGARDVFLFTAFVLLLIVMIFFLTGYLIGTRLL